MKVLMQKIQNPNAFEKEMLIISGIGKQTIAKILNFFETEWNLKFQTMYADNAIATWQTVMNRTLSISLF